MLKTVMQVQKVSVKRMERASGLRATDTVAIEEPLEIWLEYWFKDAMHSEVLAITMRTPGADRELAAGFLYSEGIVNGKDEIVEIRPLGGANGVLVELSRDTDFERGRAARGTFVNSSCGLCGKRGIDALETESLIDASDEFIVDAAVIHALPDLLSASQENFAQTGGLHAAALVSADGEVKAKGAFEDIGRHNALDKLVGACLMKGEIPLRRRILVLSSRSSFELVQKAARAGAPVLATLGSPSSLAIEAALRCGLTLIGFVRQERFNIYSGEWRIHLR